MADWRERLRAAVQRSGKKHSELARDAEIAPETLSRVLNGHHPHVSFVTVVRIVHAAGETVGWVLGERGYCLSAEDLRTLRRTVDVARDLLRQTDPGNL